MSILFLVAAFCNIIRYRRFPFNHVKGVRESMNAQGQTIHIADSIYHTIPGGVQGEYVAVLGEQYYCIQNYDQMPPFFINVVSSSDHWMFVSLSLIHISEPTRPKR